jgi:hypothetical protein
LPKLITLPTDCAFSLVSAACGLKLGHCCLLHLAPGRDDAPVEALDREGVARLGDRVLRGLDQVGIDLLEEFGGRGLRLYGPAVVDVVLDRDALVDFGHAAEMISVPMRGDQMVDLGDAGILGGGGNALGIANRRLGAGVACIDQHGFT